VIEIVGKVGLKAHIVGCGIGGDHVTKCHVESGGKGGRRKELADGKLWLGEKPTRRSTYCFWIGRG
jgi:hypothetical protein